MIKDVINARNGAIFAAVTGIGAILALVVFVLSKNDVTKSFASFSLKGKISACCFLITASLSLVALIALGIHKIRAKGSLDHYLKERERAGDVRITESGGVIVGVTLDLGTE